MAETSDQILEQIEHQRERLGANIDQLESYVKEKTDVRVYYTRSPWAFIGGAVLGGLMFAAMILPDSSSRKTRRRS